MNSSAALLVVGRIVRASFTVLVTVICFAADAQTNSWISPTSGNWQDSANWSLGVPPGAGQTVLVENHGWKAVSISANTAQNFPQTMSIGALRILSPGTDTVNTVLMNFAGSQTPLTIANDLEVSNDTAMVVLQSAVQAGSGIFVGGTMTEDGSSEVSSPVLSLSGAYYLTNGTLSISLNNGVSESLGGQFVQAGGSNYCVSMLVTGEYDLSGGEVVVPTPTAMGQEGMLVLGNFIQTGGTVSNYLSVGEIGVSGGTYRLDDGLVDLVYLNMPLSPNNGTVTGTDSSYFIQTGGTNVSGSIVLGQELNGNPQQGLGTYILTNGLLANVSLSLNGQGAFYQYGGVVSNSATTISRSQLMSLTPPFTNYFGPGIYSLNRGTFTSESVENEGAFLQTGGTCQMTTLQIGGGQYILSGGQLTISNLSLTAGGNFTQTGGAVTQTGTLTMAGASLTAGNGTQHFGELQLTTGGSTNSSVAFSPGASVLHFANSSGLVWPSVEILTISNWNGSLSGGGATQIIFGSDDTSLTPLQLGHVIFINPAGLPSGMYSAQILSDGEVVPAQGAAAGLVNSWIKSTSGNWQDATSWSLGILPGSAQSVMITNAGFKAVAIQASTPISSLTVSNVTVRGGTNGFNTLLLNFVGTGSPLVIGANSTDSPGSLILGDTNSALVMLSSALVVSNELLNNSIYSHLGEFDVEGAFTENQNSKVSAGFLQVGFSGTYNFTNSLLSVSNEIVYGHFNQQGGTNFGSVVFPESGVYNLFGGLMEGHVGFLNPYGGVFNQTGGTNISSLDLSGPGEYNLSGGLLIPGDIEVGPSSSFPFAIEGGGIDQTGGTNTAGNIAMGLGGYALEGGLLTASNLSLGPVSVREGSFGSTFNQSGGLFITPGVGIVGIYDSRLGLGASTYMLSGGELDTPTISMMMGRIDQTGGTNNVGVMTLDTVSSYVLNGGVLIVSNLTQNGQAAFSLVGSVQQSGGTNHVLDTLLARGNASYNFTNGLLIANNIELADEGTFVHAGGSFGGSANIVLGGGSWVERTAGEQLGTLQLPGGSTNGPFLNLPSGPCVLRFADSSLVPWAVDPRLTIQNWSGSVNGGGAQQVFFGTSGSGLTAQQLSQVQFSNPAGLPSGTYSARILSDGEVVPNEGSGSGSGLVNSWTNSASGNWDDAASWSLGILPTNSQTVVITNAGSKTVSINASTAVNFPGSMTVSNLFVQGATNTENTLLLNSFGTAVPLTVLNAVTLRDGGQILDLNSGLAVPVGGITVTNSQINQDGGFIRANVALQNAVYNLTNGNFEAGNLSIGLPISGRFNQYGGTAIITNLGTECLGAGAIPNGISLFGGILRLPGGMQFVGGPGGLSYLQEGGTNQTASVFMGAGMGGDTPTFTLNGGLLADTDVTILGGDLGGPQVLTQNGGSHVITNGLSIEGGDHLGEYEIPAIYNLNGGTLSAGSIGLNADEGDSQFVVSNGTVNVETFSAHSTGFFSQNNTTVILAGGSLSCSNYTTDDGGGHLNQSGGSLVVSNLLDFGGFRNVAPQFPFYGTYTLTGGTLSASNINISGIFSIGDGTTNRISNPGTFSLSHVLQIGNAVEQLGHFILVGTNATIDLAGSASRLSFANSSGEAWTGGAILIITNWNGSPSGGGAEQLKFGTDQSGLTAAQLGQIEFSVGTNLYTAKILNTGEVVPDQVITTTSVGFSLQQNNLVLTWPAGWTLQSATNAPGPYMDVTNATPPFTNATVGPRQFFRLRR